MIIERHEKTKYEPYKDRGGIRTMRRAFMSVTLLVLSLSAMMLLLTGLVATA